MGLLDRIRYWFAKPYLTQVWLSGYETGLVAGRKETEEKYMANWQATEFKPALIGARERAKLAKFRRDNLKRLTGYDRRGKI